MAPLMASLKLDLIGFVFTALIGPSVGFARYTAAAFKSAANCAESEARARPLVKRECS